MNNSEIYGPASQTVQKHFRHRMLQVMVSSRQGGDGVMRVLNISPHHELIVVGLAYLRALGFQAVGGYDLASVRDAFEDGEQVDLAVLCHTLSDGEKLSICEFICEQSPTTQILELYLTEPPATQEMAVNATTGFLPLMRALAFDRARSEIDRRLSHAEPGTSRRLLTPVLYSSGQLQ
jgi:hypothetical protein